MSTTDKSLHPVRPLRFYVMIVTSLLLFTGVSLVIHLMHLGVWGSVLTLVIATIQAAIVVLFSMGLRYEKGFVMVFVVGSLIFLIFFVALTLADVLTRGDMLQRELHNFKNNPLKSMESSKDHQNPKKETKH